MDGVLRCARLVRKHAVHNGLHGLVGTVVVLVGRSGWDLLRRADLLGAVLVGGALGCVVLTFAAAEPEREVVRS